MKFKYHYLQNSLSYQKSPSETWYQVEEEQKFTGNFNVQGFQLSEGWITFTIYSNKIRAFFKQIDSSPNLADFWEPQTIAYFRQDLPKQEEIIFEFTLQDQVEKVDGQWIPKT